jgi:hypothetical protein
MTYPPPDLRYLMLWKEWVGAGKGHEPWKLTIIFSALLLPIQCARVPSSNTSLLGVNPLFLHTAS